MNTISENTESILPEEPTREFEQPQTITRLLRWLGAITLIAAGGAYLVSTWMYASPLTRFYGILGFTSFLGAAGIFCGTRWKEAKGARTFLALAALFVPACAAQLSGLIEAQVGQSVFPVRSSAPLIEAVGPAPLAIATTASLLALVPICLLAFSALARPEGRRLTLSYLTANAVLLLPFRGPNAIALLALGLLVFLLFMDRRYFARSPLMQHWDGVAVRFTLGLPLVVLTGRTLLMFQTAPSLNAVVLAGAGLLMHKGVSRSISHRSWRALADLTALVLYAIAWVEISTPVIEMLQLTQAEALAPLRILPVALLVFGLSLKNSPDSQQARRMAALVAAGAMLYHLAVFGGLSATSLCLLIAVALTAAAFWFQDRVFLLAGCTSFIFTLLHALFSARQFWAQNLWLTLGTIGVLIVLASSLIERNWRTIRSGRQALGDRWKAWT